MTHAQTADIDAAIQKVISAVDATGLAKSCFYDLSSMFEAIGELSEKHSTVHALAGIGQYLADTWGNLNDCEREELEAELSELRSLKSKGVAGRRVTYPQGNPRKPGITAPSFDPRSRPAGRRRAGGRCRQRRG